jgi:hypothetical protein
MNWSRDNKLFIISIIVAILGIIVAITIPEVRHFLGLSPERNTNDISNDTIKDKIDTFPENHKEGKLPEKDIKKSNLDSFNIIVELPKGLKKPRVFVDSIEVTSGIISCSFYVYKGRHTIKFIENGITFFTTFTEKDVFISQGMLKKQ